MWYLITFLVYLVALAICGVAYWVGDRPLRLAAVVYIGAWTLTTLVSHRVGNGLDTPVTFVDTNATLILTWISLRWRRLWCAVLAALGMLTTLMPFVRLLQDDVSHYVLAASLNVLAICQLLTFIVAIVLTIAARRRADERAVRS